MNETVGQDLHARFLAMRDASRRQGVPDLMERRRLLSIVRDLMLDAQSEIATAIAEDFGGRARAETEMLEVVPLVNGIRHAIKSLPKWMRDERRHVALSFQPGRAWVRYEPLGVIGVISPWNYPLLLALGPLVDALAAGNCVMVKPSELTPRFSALLADLVAARFDATRVTVVTGASDVGEAFSALPFDHLVFTGSTAVGRRVMRAAAENLTPVTLELGGKSPAIVAPDYPLAKAARSLSFGKFVNAGQTCIAPDYVLAPEDRVEALAGALLDATLSAYPKVQDNEQYSSIITDRHRDRLKGALEEARRRGAVILEHPDANGSQRKIAPVIVLRAPHDCQLMTEEIFGPVLPIVGYRSLQEALDFVNERERPLALYCYTRDPRTRNLVLSRASSGGVTINGTLLHIAQDDLPFGGIGPSGMGAYHGRDGFRRFSHARAVHHVGFVNMFEQLGPPWGAMARTVGRVLTRR